MYASNYYNHVTVIQMIQNSSSQLSKGKNQQVTQSELLNSTK